jgi:hypothetical protein
MITLSAIVGVLAIGWGARMLWRAFVRATTPPVAAVPVEEGALKRA